MKRLVLLVLVVFVSCGATAQEQMRRNYMEIVVLDEDGYTMFVGSGVFLNKNTAVSVAHLFPGESESVSLDIELDLAYIRLPEKKKGIRVRWGEANVGDTVLVFGNGYGLNGVLTSHIVSKKTDEYVFIYPAVLMGTSGAGVYNTEGQLVGIVKAIWKNDVPGDRASLGIYIPAKVVKEFIREKRKENKTPPNPQK